MGRLERRLEAEREDLSALLQRQSVASSSEWAAGRRMNGRAPRAALQQLPLAGTPAVQSGLLLARLARLARRGPMGAASAQLAAVAQRQGLPRARRTSRWEPPAAAPPRILLHLQGPAPSLPTSALAGQTARRRAQPLLLPKGGGPWPAAPAWAWCAPAARQQPPRRPRPQPPWRPARTAHPGTQAGEELRPRPMQRRSCRGVARPPPQGGLRPPANGLPSRVRRPPPPRVACRCCCYWCCCCRCCCRCCQEPRSFRRKDPPWTLAPPLPPGPRSVRRRRLAP